MRIDIPEQKQLALDAIEAFLVKETNKEIRKEFESVSDMTAGIEAFISKYNISV